MTRNNGNLNLPGKLGNTLGLSTLTAIILLVGYVIFYQFAPLEGNLNDAVINSITALSALLAATVATANYLQYHPGDQPRAVWSNLMFGCWLWFAGEVFWGVMDVTWSDVPVPSLADACWLGGYIFFTIALYKQYTIIMPSRQPRIRTIAIAAWGLVISLPVLLLMVMREFTVQSYIEYYYPFADLAGGVAGILIVLAFRGGALMRPWVGLMVFGISDSLYAWAQQTSIYAWSVDHSNILTLIIDSTYLAAYLILMLGFVGHWNLIRYEMNAKVSD